jgi:hypothetical protein
MGALISVFAVLGISIIVTRVGASALTLTGLSRDIAQFQARSAFLGVGFTTSESEAIVNHPVRRRITAALIVMGNVGVVSTGASLVLSFTRATGSQAAQRAGALVVGLVLLVLLVRSKPVTVALSRLIEASLRRWTDLDVRDYASLLELQGEYGVMELQLDGGDWLAGQTLADAALRDEGVIVLGIRRKSGAYIGAPDGTTCVEPGDSLVVYARSHRLCELDDRRAGAVGDQAHADAVAEQNAIEDAEHDADRSVPAAGGV